jgi:hypothetical protein
VPGEEQAGGGLPDRGPARDGVSGPGRAARCGWSAAGPFCLRGVDCRLMTRPN